MKKLFVLIPCYNEEANIGVLIDGWMEQAGKLGESGYELIIHAIDDCSKDNTNKVIREYAAKYPGNVFLIEHEVNKNLRGGLNTAISFFSSAGHETDLLCIMDGDNTQSPRYIHDMIRKLETEKCDCVIASRYCDSSAVKGLAPHRKMMSDLAKLYYSFVLRVPGVKDYTCGYRIYRYAVIKNIAEKYGEEPIKEKSFACMMELLYKAFIVGAKFGEVGFELRYDLKEGRSKMNVIKTMFRSLSVAIKLKHSKGDLNE